MRAYAFFVVVGLFAFVFVFRARAGGGGDGGGGSSSLKARMRVIVMVRARQGVRFVRGRAVYCLTVAEDRGPYAGNKNHRNRPPQMTSHGRLHILIRFARTCVCACVCMFTNKQAYYQPERTELPHNR